MENNNNNNQNAIANQEQEPQSDDGVTLTKLLTSFFFSTIFLSCSIAAIATTRHFCTPSYDILLKIISSIYTLMLTKNIIHCLLFYFNKHSEKPINISLSTSDIIIQLLYFGLVIASYYYFVNRPENCFTVNVFPTIFLFVFILIGTINLCEYVLRFILIILCFPVLICMFLQNPNAFYSHFGIDPEILKNLPTTTATIDQCTNCVICADDIKFGDDIVILKCPGRHYFHAECIKQWLTVKVMCPMCRSENIL